MLSILKRVLFYGFLLALGIAAAWKLQIQLSGKDSATFFLSFSIVSGSLQSLNIWLLRKITDIDKLPGFGYWARKRVSERLDPRRKAVFSRAIVGIAFAVTTGLLSGYMKTLVDQVVPFWALGAASVFVLISSILLMVTLYEFYVITKLESSLAREARKHELKENALISIRNKKSSKS